jgi:arylsulfatase
MLMALAVVANLAGCSPDEGGAPAYLQLAELPAVSDVTRQLPSMLLEWNSQIRVVPPLRAQVVEDGDGLWIERTISPEKWTQSEVPGLWETPAVLGAWGDPEDGSQPVRLTRNGENLVLLMDDEFIEMARKTERTSRVATDAFFEYQKILYVGLDRAPETMTHRVFIDLGEIIDGRQRVEQHRFAGDGFAVLPGMGTEISLAVEGGGRVLRVATVAQGGLVSLPETDDSVRFRITLGEEILLDHEQRASESGTARWHAIPLPELAHGKLRLEVDGPPALTAFLCPVVGPGEIPSPDIRVRQPLAEKPDVMIFLADTFRADNLQAYGSEEKVTPYIDGFARDSMRFLRAWSPASWTLPAHASMFSGVYPLQHEALERSFALGNDVVTLAEQLRASGYRTGAVTDSLLVSHNHGLDQGFEWWDEQAGNLSETLKRVREFLDADDGRPVFLFVQTYATHAPYRVSDETRAAYAKQLDLTHNERDLLRHIRLGEGAPPNSPKAVRSERARRRYHELYLGSVVDLDRGFGEFLAILGERGLDRSGYTIFTSDHGEAFGEHGHVGHGQGVWEEDVRIPLLLRGPHVLPADVPWAASLVDLPRTVVALTDTDPATGWLGTSLLNLDEDRPVFSFQARRRAELSTRLAMIQSKRKLITIGDGTTVGTIDAIYDLAVDPDELQNLINDPPGWYQSVDKRLRPLARVLLAPIYTGEPQMLTPDQREDLRALGYADF